MTLRYEVVYSRRRTIGISVERDRRVVVRAPRNARPEAVFAAIERHRFWIWGKLLDPRKYEPFPVAREFVAGESFLFLGQSYPLELVDEQHGEIRLVAERFELSRVDRRSGRELFQRWFLSEARKHIIPRAASLARAMGLPFRRILVRDLKHSWGSCSPGGTLTFNWRIVQAPAVVVDYLIVHELAHILESNHSREFWNIVAVHVPSWTEAKDWLRWHGAGLEW
jgi:predicted metal-dependent hydrolase